MDPQYMDDGEMLKGNASRVEAKPWSIYRGPCGIRSPVLRYCPVQKTMLWYVHLTT